MLGLSQITGNHSQELRVDQAILYNVNGNERERRGGWGTSENRPSASPVLKSTRLWILEAKAELSR